MTRPPLNGSKTHPLSEYAWGVLGHLAASPLPRQQINAGVCDRFEREALVETVDLPSPYASHRGRPIRFLKITDAGRAALATRGGG